MAVPIAAAGKKRRGYKMAAKKSEVDKPERSPMVVLFAETRGFTGMSDMLEPGVVLARVGEFVTLVTEAVEGHKGAVVDILSDTLMATFTGQDDAQHAVEAAQEIHARFGTLAEAWHRDFGIRAAVSMGLHCGDAVVGFAENSPAPEQLFVFGDCVSVANRLLHRARAAVRGSPHTPRGPATATTLRDGVHARPTIQPPRSRRA